MLHFTWRIKRDNTSVLQGTQIGRSIDAHASATIRWVGIILPLNLYYEDEVNVMICKRKKLPFMPTRSIFLNIHKTRFGRC